jgi:hypothetical protein
MSTSPSYAPHYCRAIQARANFACADPMNVRSKVGLLSALLLPQNRATVSFPTNGKYQPIQVQYSQRAIRTEVGSTVAVCTPSTAPTLRSTTVEVMETSAISRTFSEAQMRRLCQSDSSILDTEIQSLLDALALDINRRLLLYVNAISTPLYGGGSPSAVDLVLNGPPPAVHFGAYANLKREMRLLGCGDVPIFIGAGELNTLSSMLEVGCCNTVSGVDLRAINGQFAYFDDVQIDAVLGANAMIAMVPGSIQLIPWYENAGEYAGLKGRVERNTIIDPVTGMRYDLTIFWDDCNNQYVVNVYVKWAVLFLPTDLYKSGDPLFQTRGFLKLTTTP